MQVSAAWSAVHVILC